MVLGVPFLWGDWDHAIGFVVTEEMEAQSELARLVADEQVDSMAKMERLMHKLHKTEKRYRDVNGTVSVQAVFDAFAQADERRLRRTLRWHLD